MLQAAEPPVPSPLRCMMLTTWPGRNRSGHGDNLPSVRPLSALLRMPGGLFSGSGSVATMTFDASSGAQCVVATPRNLLLGQSLQCCAVAAQHTVEKNPR